MGGDEEREVSAVVLRDATDAHTFALKHRCMDSVPSVGYDDS